MEERRFATPTGEPCPRCVRADGTLEGDGGCGSCGCCLLLLEAAWPAADGPRVRLDVGAGGPDDR